MDLKLEVVVLPVADVDRAKAFYTERLGFRLDADFPVDDGYRVVQVTPPGSECSIIFGSGVTGAAPGSLQGLHVIVTDIEKTVAELTERGIAVDGPFRDATGVFHHAGTQSRVAGADPQRRSYRSFAAFTDPDGNGWFLQEVTQRAPGR
ncbi:VOC family protein [Nocardia abscessus]|uniref:VOC family protein n=1 Tax=Nocardia abscessus TaxID=120957 RepID=UPI001892F995|nr:VOC family protein [Nocardia abscessus]MBF6341194.1 VOC family protein [Nocardia abscessus]